MRCDYAVQSSAKKFSVALYVIVCTLCFSPRYLRGLVVWWTGQATALVRAEPVHVDAAHLHPRSGPQTWRDRDEQAVLREHPKGFPLGLRPCELILLLLYKYNTPYYSLGLPVLPEIRYSQLEAYSLAGSVSL